MAKRLEWVKWYFTDWMVGVRRMTWAARGVYMEALCLQFHGERLPVSLEDWQTLFPGAADGDLDQVMLRFELREDERGEFMVNRRLEVEMNDVQLRKDKAKKASFKRWESSSNASALPHAHDEHSLSHPIEKRREEKRLEEKREEKTIMLDGVERDIVDLSTVARRATCKPKMRLPEGALDDIWNLFPKKVGKKTAVALVEKAIRDYAREWELDTLDDAAQWMRDCVERMAKRYTGTDERFIPHPATWLRQGRYEDPVEEMSK
ncbi:hypothetical protein UFOVP824_33 [uncultured Caudovirales phage]|uniref:Uncharacterized protein n=1 Tax=uncultured Caudovirales phage TaxID=2100421 RepID=A0A6J5P1E8_9CAUD|nr:hypothetical protein UFOVP824_33 [uncultured Caudovirales phage]